MDERHGQGIFIGVSVAVMCIAGLLYFFPEPAAENSTPAQAQGQVILPRTSSPSTPRPRPAANKPTSGEPATESEPADPHEIWQVIYLGRHRIGYSRTTFESAMENGRERIRAISEMHMAILRFGQTTRMRIRNETVEKRNGDLLSFRTESGSGRRQTTAVGNVQGDRLVIQTTTNGQRSRRFYPWKAGIKSPTFQDRLVRSSPMKPGEIRRFQTFMPELGHAVEVRLAAESVRTVTGRDGKPRRLLRVRVTNNSGRRAGADGSPNPNSGEETVYVYLDRRGWPVVSESDFVGKKLRHYTVSKTEALQAIEGPELDLGVSTLLRVPMIRDAHRKKRIVYRIHMADGDPAAYLPKSPTQRIRKIDAHTVELTVVRAQVPRRRVHVRTKREYVNASRFLQSNDPRVRQHARRAAGNDTDAPRVAMQMERYVHERLVNKNFSTAMASAADVAKNLAGDCTEHAVLLAAMLRVKRIPSRVAVGLVYVPRLESFGAHMWTEAWINGEWVALDATLGQGGTGAAHIKLADASFADDAAAPASLFIPLMNVLGRWRIEVREVK